jgi:hypothetical protein
MLSSNMLLPNLIPLIDVTFSTPTPDYTHPVKEDVKKKFSLLPSEGGEACIQPLPASPHFLEGFWFYRFGSPRSSAAMPAPVADPDLMVSWSGGA